MKSTLKIAYCLPNIMQLHQVTNGELTQQAATIDGLRNRGHKITFVFPENNEEIICTDNLGSLSVAPRTWTQHGWFELAAKGSWRIQQIVGAPYLNFYSNLRAYDASMQCLPGNDLVHERLGLYRTGVAKACKKLRLPYVVFFDADPLFELDYLERPIKGLLRRRAVQMIRFSLSVADCVICVSQAVKSQLIDNWHIPDGKIAVLANAVDVNVFKPDPDKRLSARAELGIEDEPLIIFVGSFFQWHDVKTLLDAFERILSAYPHARLLLVGDGDLRQSMQTQVFSRNLVHNVIFAGRRPASEIPRFLNAADIAVAPYPKMEQEFWGSPMKLFEYMASGKAVVASEAGQISEIIDDGVDGCLVSPGDVSELANTLDNLIRNPALRDTLGSRARGKMVKDYSWDSYIARLEAVYASAIEGKRGVR